jgi:hypothetical protein
VLDYCIQVLIQKSFEAGAITVIPGGERIHTARKNK